jgi:hypothetical protein
MAVCDVCGNDYDKTFTVSGPLGGGTYDCFECAIFANAPTCRNCRCMIVGHGVETPAGIFGSAGCARRSGVPPDPDSLR